MRFSLGLYALFSVTLVAFAAPAQPNTDKRDAQIGQLHVLLSAPVKTDNKALRLDYLDSVLTVICALKKPCLLGDSFYLRANGGSCECPGPSSPLLDIVYPCADFECPEPQATYFDHTSRTCLCKSIDNFLTDDYILEDKDGEEDSIMEPGDDFHLQKRDFSPTDISTRPTDVETTVDTAVPTYIPPPKKDLTPELIAESLAIQPQNTATVASVIPHLGDGVISFLVQLDGQVAGTLVMNASTSLPCGRIGMEPEPNIMLVPKTIMDGAQQKMIAECLCIAVNVYNPNVTTYWVQNLNGSIYSLAGSNKVQDIDKIDASAGALLNMLPSSAGVNKRLISESIESLPLERRQIFEIECGKSCPLYYMHQIRGSYGYCGCVFNKPDQMRKISGRGIVEPGIFNAKMTPEACSSMVCTNFGGRPAVFNPFSNTCWCTTPAYVENNPSAWTGAKLS